MPQLCIRKQALAHNLALVRQCAAAWGATWLPVVKMVASYPPVMRFLRENGICRVGIADIDEHLCFGENPVCEQAYINIAPALRAAEVVTRFERSAVSGLDGLQALEDAAARLGKVHSVLVMLDLGDGREGIPCGREFDRFLEAVRAKRFVHIRFAGLGATLGCLMGLCPDFESMEQIFAAMRKIRGLISVPDPTVSLGGTIFWNWFAEHHGAVREKMRDMPGWNIELRMGDPLFVGFDMYRNEPLLGGAFRQDVFELQAQVLEVQTKYPKKNGTYVSNGHGEQVNAIAFKAREQALVDCGSLHTDTADIMPYLAGARLINYSGNYTILDVTECGAPPRPGDMIGFRPGYWAVARSFRTPQTRKIWLEEDGDTVCFG